jgi:hypothetical protein
MPSNPGYVSGGTATATALIAAAQWSAGTATITTSGAHGFVSGQYVNVANLGLAGYDGNFQVTRLNSTQFSYSLASDPGGSYPTDSSAALPGFVRASRLQAGGNAYLSGGGGKFPVSSVAAPDNGSAQHDGVIHVRMDIMRSYDATARRASLTMKAYVADRFNVAVGDTCTISEFENLSQNLSDLCSEGIYLEQDGIPINDTATATGITSASWDPTSRVATVKVAAGNLVSGQTVNVVGATPAGYNGSYLAAVSGGNASLTRYVGADPGTYVSGGTAAAEALSAVYFGFTTGNGSASGDNQQVVISNLLLRAQ